MARESGKLARGLNQRVAHATSRLDDHRYLLGLVVLAFGAFLAYVAFASTTGPPFQSPYQIKVDVPADAPVLRRGQEVRVGGRLAGLISAVEPNREEGGATVTANITKTNFRPMPADTEAYVRVHSIVYRTYLELRPGESPEELEHEDFVAEPATSGVDLLEVVQLFDEETRESLRETVVNTGFGVAGRGKDVNQALADLPELSRDAARQLRAATRTRGAISRAISGAAGTASGLRGERSGDVAALIDGGEATLTTTGARAGELAETIRLLGPFEQQFLRTAEIAEPVLDDLAVTVSELDPAVRNINSQLPQINRLLGLGPILREDGVRITELADPVLEGARPTVFNLFPTMTALKPLNRDVGTLVDTVEPYLPEVAESGRTLSNAASVPYPQGLAPGAPAGRVIPILTPHRCRNSLPDPGEAKTDRC